MISAVRHAFLRPRQLAPTRLAVILSLVVGLVFGISPTLGLVLSAILVTLVVGVLLLIRPPWVCYILVFAIPLISGMPRNQVVPLLRPNEVLLLGFFGLVLVRKLLVKDYSFRVTFVDKGFIVLFLGVSVIPSIAFLIRENELSTEGAFVYLSIIQYYIFYRIIVETIRSEKEARNAIIAYFAAGLIVTLIGLLEAARIPIVQNFLFAYYPSGHLTRTLQINRIVSILGNWHAFAAFAVLQVVLVILFWSHFRTLFHRWLLAISGLSAALTFVPVASLAGLVGLISSFGILPIISKRTRKVIILITIIILISTVLFWPFVVERFQFQFGQSDSWIPRTGEGRIRKWSTIFWPAIKSHIFLGYGPLIPESFAWQTQESQYVALLFRGGIVSLFAHLYFVVAALIQTARISRNNQTIIGVIALCAFMSLIIMSVMGIANEYFSYSGVAETLWLLMGLATIKSTV